MSSASPVIQCVLGGAPDSLPDKLSRNGTCVLHGTDVLTLLLSLPSPWEPLQMVTGVEMMSNAGRTTAWGRDLVSLGTLTRSPAATPFDGDAKYSC